MGDTGYLIFDPVWRPVVWKASEIGTAVSWTGAAPPDSFWLPWVADAAAAQSSAA
jgi:catechol 2,3-dioxygenase